MATQLKPTDFQPIPFPAARPKLRVVFETATATEAVASALGQMPPAVRGATLEEIEIASATEALIATARQLLSPHMFGAFLRWGQAAALAVKDSSDEEASPWDERMYAAVRAIAAATAMTTEDLMLKAWIAGIEAGDCTCFGPLIALESAGKLVMSTTNGLAADLRQLSDVTHGIDLLATKVWALSPTTSVWSAPLADAVASAFAAAQEMAADLPAAEMFTRGEVERIPSRFHRGLLLEWNRAFAAYREAEVAARCINCDDATASAVGYALVRLMLTSAPSPAALAIKARVYEEAEGWELTAASDVARVFAGDARRFARLGNPIQADKPVLDAFATYRSGLIDFYALPDDLSHADEEPCFARMDPASEALVAAKATTVEGVIAKLRYGFQALGQERWVHDVILDPGSKRFRDGVAMDGLSERVLWGAIEDLARIAGVSLTEKTA